MPLIKVVPYVLGMNPGVPGAPEPRSGYFLVLNITKVNNVSPDNFAPPSIYNYLCIKGMYQIFTVFIYHDLLMVIIILTAYRGFLRIHF